MNSFSPNALLRNSHVQSILASSKVRHPWVRQRAADILNQEQSVITEGDDGVRLSGYYNAISKNAPLAVIIHGWEGSAHSQYMLSAAAYLHRHGFAVYRLQLRDHGDSHHLNPEVFHSCRLTETAEAVRQIAVRFKPKKLFLGGFSLGGNFSLRIARHAPSIGLSLDGVCAISPVIDPTPTLATMETGPWIYREYFMKKWRRSLRRKVKFFPDAIDISVLETHKSLISLTEVLVTTIGQFDTVQEYFDGYSVRDTALSSLSFPTVILSAKDDPIVPDEPLTKIEPHDNLSIKRTIYGGHCGFVENIHRESYADRFMLDWFDRLT